MKNTSILLIEDEPILGDLIVESLKNKGFHVSWEQNGTDGLSTFNKGSFDLLIVDIMLPKMNGYEIVNRIRNHNDNTPIIFLTAKTQTEDLVKGFKTGGNDYIKKPFKMAELVVRMENLLGNTTAKKAKNNWELGNYKFDFTKQSLQFKEEEAIILTTREAEVLELLLESKNEIMDRKMALQKLWKNDDFFSARSMDVFISKLRRKLQKDERIQILNARGKGYKLLINE
jgi:DNA-binding response OmpR family regulator